MAELQRRLTELLAYMDETRAALCATAQDINPAFATMRPKGGSWSAAEVVTHLAMVEDGVGRLISKAIKKAREEGVGPATSDDSILSSLDKYRLTETVLKVKAPSTITPDNETSVAKALASLEQSRAKLRDALINGADMDLASITRPHPMLGEISLYQWALFVAQHEERHRKQIERTLDEVTELAAESAPIV